MFFTAVLSFQSTHPLRGATNRALRLAAAIGISIHAPLAGCDPLFEARNSRFAGFQSTHPLRGATSLISVAIHSPYISIHAPLAGCDVAFQPPHDFPHISIHAPLAGCDTSPFKFIAPRLEFQSTHPLRGATRLYRWKCHNAYISIHAPLAGCDSGVGSSIITLFAFQSTHPLRGATRRATSTR